MYLKNSKFKFKKKTGDETIKGSSLNYASSVNTTCVCGPSQSCEAVLLEWFIWLFIFIFMIPVSLKLCPTEYRENVWIPGYKAQARATVCVWRVSYPRQALSTLSLQDNSSRDQAAMEETCTKSISYSFGT
jgi:hypothetical protein